MGNLRLPLKCSLVVTGARARSRALHYYSPGSMWNRFRTVLCGHGEPHEPTEAQREMLPLCQRCRAAARSRWGVEGDPLREVRADG